MDKLWAPWRIKYIKAKKRKICIFCLAAKSGRGNYVITKTAYSIAMLNSFPYNNGHMLISPLRHVKELQDLKEVEVLDLMKTLNYAKGLLDKVIKPEGYNIGINISESAGAGIPGHLHIHLVGRWKGDTNFMATLSNTRVISQSLDELYKQLKITSKKIFRNLS